MQDMNTSQPLVSVVIASYNMGQFLGQAVDSILAQKWRPLEIIVVDDGSTDDTPQVMSQYANNSLVNYIRTPNQGQPKAKNTGIKATKGDFIAFCDADDLWEPNKLEEQMPLFSNPKVGVVYSQVSNIDEHDKRYELPTAFELHNGKVTDHLLMRNFIPFGTAVIRRACVEKNGMFDEQFRMGIDWDLWLRYSLDWEFAYTRERTYIYRVWSGQMSTNYRGRYEHAIRILNNFVKNHGEELDPKQLKRAWADTYINQANAIARHENKPGEVIKGYIKGLMISPGYWHGWRSLIKWFLGRHRNKNKNGQTISI